MQSLWELDQSLFRAIHVGLHQAWLDPVFWMITLTGTEWVLFPFFLSFFPWRRGWIVPLFGSWAVAGLINTVWLKHAIDRDRPSYLPYAHPQEPIYHHAFPSGHTALAFAAAATIALLSRDSGRKWVGGAAFAWATLVGISRIYRGVHWPSDVLGGALVGIGSGCLVYLVLEKFARGFGVRRPAAALESPNGKPDSTQEPDY